MKKLIAIAVMAMASFIAIGAQAASCCVEGAACCASSSSCCQGK